MRKLILLGLYLSLSACGETQPITPAQETSSPKPATETSTAPEAPAIDALAPTSAELKALASEYKTFSALNQEFKPSNIHGARVKTFLDPVGFEAFTQEKFPLPTGTTVIKERYNSIDGPLSLLYVMKKINGYDPANNDWYYAVMSPEGIPSQEGKIGFCMDCHRGAKAQDYLFGFKN